MTMPPITNRDWRKLLAMLLLSGGGMALTVFAWRTTTLVAERSTDAWPLAYSLYGVLALVGIVLVSLGWVIGKTSLSGSVGAASFEVSGGEAEAAQIVADAAQDEADAIKAAEPVTPR